VEAWYPPSTGISQELGLRVQLCDLNPLFDVVHRIEIPGRVNPEQMLPLAFLRHVLDEGTLARKGQVSSVGFLRTWKREIPLSGIAIGNAPRCFSGASFPGREIPSFDFQGRVVNQHYLAFFENCMPQQRHKKCFRFPRIPSNPASPPQIGQFIFSFSSLKA
jgi:hypothetical protein